MVPLRFCFSDIDECLSIANCHACINTAGSFLCSCNPGYSITANGSACEGRTAVGFLILSHCFNDLNVRIIPLVSLNALSQFKQVVVVKDLARLIDQ